ncbi:MAG: ATP-dependent DNA helicase II subunit 1 [Cyphobasidiales sp. Tagirdzhanova-0007]|nr:MAG: ATP-dependent DNA helicase II subunit 1 [Cyphobasidiales sp. Tagirdzhanova-0007]
MLESSPDRDSDDDRVRSNVSSALKSALELMKTRIISGSPRDVIQTRNVAGELTKDGVYMLIEPSTICATSIKALSDIVEEAETSPKSFLHKFSPIDTEMKSSQLIEGMRFSEKLLKSRSSNLSARSLYLITDNDDPFQGNKLQQSVALVFANDAHESGFQIKTFFMPADASIFRLEKFWNRFRYDPSMDVEMDNASMVFSGELRFDKLLSLSSESGKTKRAMFSIPLFLYEGIAMSVTGYAAIGEQKKKPPVQVEQAEEIREVYFKTQYTDQATGEDLIPKKDIVSYASVGTKNEYANSIPAFSALLQSMLKKDVIGLGVLIARSNSSPQLVYMLPQAETRDEETDVQIDPPCIWLVQIPFADDIRAPIATSSLSVMSDGGESNSMIQVMKKLIKKLKVQFRPYQFTNPTLQYHYSNLEAIALQLDAPEPKDETLPLTDQIAKASPFGRIGSYAKDVKAELEDHPLLYSSRRSGLAAGAGGADGNEDEAGPSKKVRVSKERASQGIEKLEKLLMEAFESENFKAVTNDVLKDYLKQKDVKGFSTKKKAELLAMAKELLEHGKLI